MTTKGEEWQFLCNMCGEIVDTKHPKYCWPSDSELVRKTSEDRKSLEAQGYTAELAQFRIRYVELRQSIVELLRCLDERLTPAAYAAFFNKGKP